MTDLSRGAPRQRFRELGSRLEAPAYALLRIVAGGMIACHGMQKVLGWLATKKPPAVGSQLWVGGMIELVCGVLLALGLFVRPVAFLLSGTMAVAYLQFHWKLDMHAWEWLPIVNKGELAVLYCFAFLYMVGRGAGPIALDNVRHRR